MKLITALMIGILVTIPSVLAFGPVTGYFTSSGEGETIMVDTMVETSFANEYDLLMEGAVLASVRIYGSVEGDGSVKAFAEDVDGNRFKIVDYAYQEKGGLSNLITGFLAGIGNSLTGEIADEEDYAPVRYLDAMCEDTCVLNGAFKGSKLKVSVSVEPGTKFNFYKIYYETYVQELQQSASKKSLLAVLWDKIFG
jgi:hypothetical protein